MLFPPHPRAMKVTTRASNAAKHPGVIDGGGVKRKRQTWAEMQADAEKKELEKVSVEKKKTATINRIAALEDQMAKQDIEAKNKLKEGRRPHVPHEVEVDEETGSEFRPGMDGPLTSDDGESYEIEEDTPKPKKMKVLKVPIREQIKNTHAEAAKGKVGFLALPVEHIVTINPAQKRG